MSKQNPPELIPFVPGPFEVFKKVSQPAAAWREIEDSMLDLSKAAQRYFFIGHRFVNIYPVKDTDEYTHYDVRLYYAPNYKEPFGEQIAMGLLIHKSDTLDTLDKLARRLGLLRNCYLLPNTPPTEELKDSEVIDLTASLQQGRKIVAVPKRFPSELVVYLGFDAGIGSQHFMKHRKEELERHARKVGKKAPPFLNLLFFDPKQKKINVKHARTIKPQIDQFLKETEAKQGKIRFIIDAHGAPGTHYLESVDIAGTERRQWSIPDLWELVEYLDLPPPRIESRIWKYLCAGEVLH